MPRRHTSSAAGALAAALLAAACAPASAQDAPTAAQDATAPGLRGSLGAQDTGEASPAPPSLQRRRRSSDRPPGDSGESTTAGQTVLDNLADDVSLTPAPPAPPPPLGGIGDETGEPVPAVPEFGIATQPGGSGGELPGLEDSLRQRPLPPDRHVLDPYLPIGMKLGSFLLFTQAEVGTILTDNVLGTRTNMHSDVAFDFAPNVRLESNWARHFFSAEFDADRSWYKDFSVEDDRTYFALLRGRLDVTRRSHLSLELGKSQTQEGRNSISLTDIAGIQTSIYEEHITAGAEHTFNRVTIEVEGTVADYNYEDLDNPAFGVVIPRIGTIIPERDIRDFREDELRLRGSYEFNSELAAFVEGGISQEVYRQPVSVDGITRDSDGFQVISGLTFAKPRFSGEISVGWGEQTSIDEAVGPIEGVLLNADLIWLPTPMTMIEFLARSEVSTTTLVDSLGAVDRFYELSIQHAFWRYLVVGGFVSYEIADYAANPLVDQRLKEGASAEYYFGPHMSVFARYEHTDFFSTDRFSDFTENEVRIGMRIRH